MLSRVADSLYWIGRYVERAENTARLLDVALRSSRGLSVSFYGETDTRDDLQLLLSIIDGEALYGKRGGRISEDGLATFLVIDRDNPLSVISCLSVARENARGVRDIISTEMWEELNRTYLSLQRVTPAYLLIEGLHEFCRQIRTASQLFHGVTDATMPQDEPWHFLQAGRYLERAGTTSRILAGHSRKFAAFQERPRPEDVHRWLALLRSISAYEAYMRLTPGGVQPDGVVAFLLLNQTFPRTVAFGCRKVHEEIDAIDRQFGNLRVGGPADRAGALSSRLRYASADDLSQEKLLPLLIWIRQQCDQIGNDLQRVYFEGGAPEMMQTTMQPMIRQW